MGTVEVGKVANLVLLDADPRRDIRNLGRIEAVVLRGRLLDENGRAALLEAVEAAPDLKVNDWPRMR